MSRVFNMPIQADVDETEAHRGGKKKSVFYSPLPAGKTQGVGNNRLFFALFRPATWPIFNNVGPMFAPNTIPQDLVSFYWKLHVHYVPVRMPDGSVRDGMPIICMAQQNKYHVDILKHGPVFTETRCRVCEEAEAKWKYFQDEWDRTTVSGQPLNDRWGYHRDDFTRIVSGNPVLKVTFDEASMWTQSPRWMFEVLDLDKVMGTRKLDPEETGVQFEPYFSSKQVFDGLKTLHDMGVKFYDENAPQVIVVTKDTSKGARWAKYSATNLGPWAPLDPAYRAYIADEANLPVIVGGQPGDEDAHILILSYEEQRDLLGMMGPPGSGSTNIRSKAGSGMGATAQLVQPYVPPAAVAPITPYTAPASPVTPYTPPGAPPQYTQPIAPQPTYAAPPPMPAPVYAPPPVAQPQPAYVPPPQPQQAPPPVAPGPAPAPVLVQPSLSAPLPPAPVASAPLPPQPQAPAPTFQPGAAPAPVAPPAPAPAPADGSPKPRRRGQNNW